MESLMLSTVRPEIAFSARFYNSNGRQSYQRIYLSRYDGTHRRQLTFGRNSAYSPIWLDRNHLAYLEFEGRDRADESARRTARFKVLNLISGQNQTLKILRVSDDWTQTNSLKKTVYVDGFDWKFSKSGVTRLKRRDDDAADREAEKPIWTRKAGHYTLAWVRPEPMDEEGPFSLTVKLNRKSQTFRLKGSTVVHAFPIDDAKIYVVTEPSFTKFNWENIVYLLDTAAHTSRTVIAGVGRIDFDPKRPLWLGSQTDPRILPKLKDGRQIWGNWLYCGNWHTGQRWMIATGTVMVWSAAFRPG